MLKGNMSYLLGVFTNVFANDDIALAVLILVFVIPSIIMTLYFANRYEEGMDFPDVDSPSEEKEDRLLSRKKLFEERSEYDMPVEGYNIDHSISRDAIKVIAHSGKEKDELAVDDPGFRKFKEDALRTADRQLAEHATDRRIQQARALICAREIKAGKDLLNEVVVHEHQVRISRDDFNRLRPSEQEKRRKNNKQFALAYMYKGAVEWMEDNTHTAVSSYQRATILDPASLESWNRLGQLYDYIGNVDKAIECYKEADKIGEKRRALKLQQIIKENLNFLYDHKMVVKKRIGRNTKGTSL